MKKYCYALIVILMAVVSVGLASCGDDEPEGADIVGTWALDTSVDDNFALFFQFTKDGKFHEVQTSIVNGETTVRDVFHGTYRVSGHKLFITYIFENENETVECDYSMNGDKLTLYIDGVEDPATFTRVKNSVIEPYL